MENSVSRSDRILEKADSTLARLENISAAIGAWVIFGLMLLSIAEILSRNLWGAPIRGQFDLIILIGPLYGLLAMSYCYRKAGHVRMDLLNRKLSGRPAWLAELIITLGALLITVQLFQGSAMHFERSFQIGDTTLATNWPTWPSKLVVPIAFALLIARLLVTIWAFGRLVISPDQRILAVPVPPNPVTERID